MGQYIIAKQAQPQPEPDYVFHVWVAFEYTGHVTHDARHHTCTHRVHHNHRGRWLSAEGAATYLGTRFSTPLHQYRSWNGQLRIAARSEN